LYNRKQRVLLQLDSSPNILSDWETVRHGGPQGSVLGPLLLNVYINNFPSIIGRVSHTILFADDTNILVSSSNHTELNTKLNKVFCCISEWFQNNQLVLNLNKMQLIKFISSKSSAYPLRVSYNNQAHTVAENIKFLGVCLDCHLTWNLHLDNLIKKLSSVCFLLRKLSSIVNVKMIQMAYFAHFHSQINYVIIIWGSSSSMRNVFIIQKRAIRSKEFL
jgi:hypothetical protein